MPSIDNWAGNTFPLGTWVDDTDIGMDNGRIIADKSVSITIVRLGVTLSAQSVRIEELRARDRENISAGGLVGKVDALLIGYKSHPTITDTDVQRGDTFVIDGESYEVVGLMPGLTDSVQAYLKVRS